MTADERILRKRVAIEHCYQCGAVREKVTQELYAKGDINRRDILERFDEDGELRTVNTVECHHLGHKTLWREGYVGGTLCIQTSIVIDGESRSHSIGDWPSSIELWPTGAKRILYTKNGIPHREKGEPAYIEVDDKGNTTQTYYVDGELNRPGKRPVVEKIKAKPLPGFTP
ncbi:MAG: hypothetical protein PHW63_02750 [Alphaproteobacteria bacterium]|nr:hypothetical protein [Alphaproteobacteria bacterium]